MALELTVRRIPLILTSMDADVIIIGAGAAGLFCAVEAGKRGRRVLVLEHNKTVGEKIRISGGGRCNFTNMNVTHGNYLSRNPHFCKSALARYTPKDFIALLGKHRIRHEERKWGQLFCEGSAQQIIDMLLYECKEAGVRILTRCVIDRVTKEDAVVDPAPRSLLPCPRFIISSSLGSLNSSALVIATGGLSIPTLGATPFGFQIANQFGLSVTPTRPGLVPLLFNKHDLKSFHALSGVSIDAMVTCADTIFREHILFTHRGLSGPAILQASSYLEPNGIVEINLLPEIDAVDYLLQHHASKKELRTLLEYHLPSRFVRAWEDRLGGSQAMFKYSEHALRQIAHDLAHWRINPAGTEGYGKAEVTVGGIDTDELSSKTLEARKIPGLFFIGEVVDVTGWLGGYNFQWAWSSGWAAGQVA